MKQTEARGGAERRGAGPGRSWAVKVRNSEPELRPEFGDQSRPSRARARTRMSERTRVRCEKEDGARTSRQA
jgi:hypothetical protein